MQVYFDIGTPAEVFKVLNEEIEKHMEANQNELTGEFACCNFGCAPAVSHITLMMLVTVPRNCAHLGDTRSSPREDRSCG